MIISDDEAAKLINKKMTALLRFTKRPPEPATPLELVTLRDGMNDLVAKALVKSVRDVDFSFFANNQGNCTDHGYMSTNGLKRHISTMYSPDVWDSFVSGKLKLTRIKIDYSIVEKEAPKQKPELP